MSGTDSIPDAGNGRPADSDRRSDDGATRLAEALIAQLERIGTPTRAPVLTGAQARLETHYALLSNLLCNFGRHGTARDALLSPPPTLERRDCWEWISPLFRFPLLRRNMSTTRRHR